ncbi:unnamed protein product [Anisakis simplex]|uniref:Mini-chromosome maintenance complex-binding protein n=1 Tax=Anisakis simplex TaxID=6269 RepID=A0A0M3J6K9_ANISI|nr:unnamed protein product [Anisakis simplex]
MDVDECPTFNFDNMFKFVDTLFERNVDEYSKNPEKLMEVVKAQCLPHFQSCKSLNCIGYDMVKDGELVRMRCMIQDAKGVEMFVASGIAHDDIDQQNGSNPGNDTEKTVCGVLRDSLKCTVRNIFSCFGYSSSL